MSADNYYVIRRHPISGFAAVMGFASSHSEPIVDDSDTMYETLQEAFEFARDEMAEYGVDIHPECW